MDKPEDRIQLQDAAVKLGISRDSVMRRLSKGELDGGKDQLSGLWFVTQASIDVYIALSEAS
jgi:hypothetical protein